MEPGYGPGWGLGMALDGAWYGLDGAWYGQDGAWYGRMHRMARWVAPDGRNGRYDEFLEYG